MSLTIVMIYSAHLQTYHNLKDVLSKEIKNYVLEIQFCYQLAIQVLLLLIYRGSILEKYCGVGSHNYH